MTLTFPRTIACSSSTRCSKFDRYSIQIVKVRMMIETTIMSEVATQRIFFRSLELESWSIRLM